MEVTVDGTHESHVPGQASDTKAKLQNLASDEQNATLSGTPLHDGVVVLVTVVTVLSVTVLALTVVSVRVDPVVAVAEDPVVSVTVEVTELSVPEVPVPVVAVTVDVQVPQSVGHFASKSTIVNTGVPSGLNA